MHEIRKRSFDSKESKEKILAECKQIAKDYGDGFWGTIQWKEDKIFASYADASEYIDEIDKDYLQIAVKYYEIPSKFLENSKVDALKAKDSKLQEEMRQFQVDKSPRNAKAAYISCSSCNSKLNKEFLRGHQCPVCRGELFSEKTLEKLESYRNKIEEVRSKIKEEERRLTVKNAKNAKIKWLVKFEYHS